MKAPEIKHYISWLGRLGYRNVNSAFTYDEASYVAIDQIFHLLHRLEPDPESTGWELWLRAERGTIEDFGSFEELREDGQVENFKEFETWWLSEFPEEVEWFHFAAVEDPKIGYRAMGYTGTEKSEKEQYTLHADGRDDGLSELDGDSPEAFARWLKEHPRSGHPWEVCRGGNSTHIDCIVHRDEHGYYLVVAGLAETRTIEAIRFFLALHRAGAPVCIRNAEELKARLTGAESIGIVPEGVFPAYCHARFPGEGIVDFMNLPRERQDELAKYCRWQPIPVPRLKKEVETS